MSGRQFVLQNGAEPADHCGDEVLNERVIVNHIARLRRRGFFHVSRLRCPDIIKIDNEAS
jgi:hypothetical protein